MFAYINAVTHNLKKRKYLKSATNSKLSFIENQDSVSWETKAVV